MRSSGGDKSAVHAAREFLMWENTKSLLFGVLRGIDELVEHPHHPETAC